MGAYVTAAARCTECNIEMHWIPGGYGQPVEGRCGACYSKLAQEIGWSMDAMVSGPRLAAEVATVLALLAQGGISHSRQRGTIIYVYRYDASSPSGVLLAGCFSDHPEVTALLRGGFSAL